MKSNCACCCCKHTCVNESCACAKVLEHFGVSKEQVLLIDDDPNNCSAFAAEGGVSLRVAGDRGFDCANLEVV